MDNLKPIGFGPAPVRDTTPTVTPLRDTAEMPGTFNFDIGSPAGLIKSSQANVESADDFMTGLGSFLFGENNGSVLGGTPIGAVARGVAQVPGVELAGDVVANLAGAGISAAYEAVHHVPLGWLPGGSDATFNALPKTPEWLAVNEASNLDLLGGGNQKFEYTKKWLEDAQQGIKASGSTGTPFNLDTLSSGLLAGPGGSAGQLLGQMFDMFQLPQRYAERGIAGTGKILTGQNRVQETLSRAAAGETDLSDVELAVVQHVGDGTWTEERALDFMASHGAGLSHDAVLQLAGTFATDPTVVVSLGSGGLARLGKVGVNVLEQGLGASATLTRAQRAGVAVAGFQQGELGNVAKIARNIMDPLNTFSSLPGGSAAVDLLTNNVAVKGFHNAFGRGAADAYRIFDAMGVSSLAQSAAAGRGTTVAAQLLAARRQATALVQGLGYELMETVPAGETINDLLRNAPSNIEQMVREETQRTWKFLWGKAGSEDRVTLAKQYASSFGGDEAEWLTHFNEASDDALAFAHNILYGQDEKTFRTIAAANASEYTGTLPYERLNMVNDSTLHDLGARSIIKALSEASLTPEAIDAGFTSVEELQLSLLRDFQKRFADMQKYVIDPANPQKAIKYAIDDLNNRLASGTLPAMVTEDEMAKMPIAIQELMAKMEHRILAFRPEDGKLWNIEQNAEGLYSARGNPWIEHLMEGVEYRPGYNVVTNLVGQALPDVAGKPLDWLVSGSNLLTKRVSGTAIRENARQRAVKFGAEGYGLDEKTVRDIFDALTDHMNVAKKMTVRSLSADDMWEVARTVVPRNSGLTRRAVLAMVLDGFEGDLRYVGLPIKFTGRMKKLIAKATGGNSNFAGEVSEDLYNKIRFRYNPLFQVQEYIEPWVLNSQRGISMTERGADADIAMEAVRRNLVSSGLMREGDTDAVELGALINTGHNVVVALGDTESKMKKLGTTDTRGLKRFSQLRGIMQGKGRVVRGAFKDAGIEDEFLAFKKSYSEEMGRVVDDNETALRWLSGQQSSNLDIGIDYTKRPGERLMNFDNLMRQAEEHTPKNMGELKTLALEAMSRHIGYIRDIDVSTIAKLRHQLAIGAVTVDEVGEVLRQLGAGTNYVNRVTRALNFHWVDFWAQARQMFNMTEQEVLNMQHFITRAARTQDMKPAEFLSQIVEGTIAEGKGGVRMANELEHIGDALSALRANKEGATAADMADQLGSVFWQHMHQSGREALLNSVVRVNPEQARRFSRSMAKPIVKTTTTPPTPTVIKGTPEQIAADGSVIPAQSPADHFAFLHPRPANYFNARVWTAAPGATDRKALTDFEDEVGATLKKWTGNKTPRNGTPNDIETIDPITSATGTGTGPRTIGFVIRDNEGRQAGVLILGLDDRGVPEAIHSIAVREDVRRMGLATALYDQAQSYGYDVKAITGTGGVTPSGKLFSEAYKRDFELVNSRGFGLMGAKTDPQGNVLRDAKGEIIEGIIHQVWSDDAVGPGIRALPWADQERILNMVQNVLDQFPHAEVQLYEVFDMRTPVTGLGMGVHAYVFDPDDMATAQSVVILDRKSFLNSDPVAYDAYWAAQAKAEADWTANSGRPFAVSGTPEGVIYHEMGHTIWNRLRNAYGGRMNPKGYEASRLWINKYMKSGVPDKVSDYSVTGESPQHEAFAEMFDLAFNPQHRGRALPADVQKEVDDFRKVLEDAGEYVPRPGVVTTTTRPGWTSDMTDAMLSRAASGVPDANPDVERIYRYFSKWARGVLGEGSLGPDSGTLGDVLRGMPTEEAVPYNKTHALLYDTVSDRMKQLENDTYRLQYFSRDRTLLERSINHPFFGLYPASYMWFKIMPELVRFIAKEPFGLSTGAMAYTLADVEKAVAIQREYDPSFDKMVEDVGHSSVIWMLGYLLPATPWEIPASAPTWMRDLSQQGLDAAARAEAGKPAKDMNFWSPVNRVQDYVSPMRSADQLNRVVKELGNTISGSKPEQKAGGGSRAFPVVGPFPNEQASPVQQLFAPLGDAMDELTKALSQIGAPPAA